MLTHGQTLAFIKLLDSVTLFYFTFLFAFFLNY